MKIDLRELHRRTGRKVALFKIMSINTEVDRLYADGQDGGKGLRAVENVREPGACNDSKLYERLKAGWLNLASASKMK